MIGLVVGASEKRLRVLAIAIASVAVAAGAACGLESQGLQDDGNPAADDAAADDVGAVDGASGDGAPSDAGESGAGGDARTDGLAAGDAGDAAPSGDAACAYVCNGNCVADCSGCSGSGQAFACGGHFECSVCDQCDAGTTECYQCADAGLVASCANGGDKCPNSNLCSCDDGGAPACPGDDQVCMQSAAKWVCKSCGAPGTNNLTCHDPQETCQASQSRCH